METLPYLIGGGLLAAAVVFYVLLPLIQGREAPLRRTVDEYSEDEFRKQVALSAIQDVEYDYLTGKMDEEDYRELKKELSREALRILESLRDQEGESRGGEGREGEGSEGEGSEGAGVDEGQMDALEEEIARIRKGLQEGTACRACAQLNPKGSRYCGRCGRELEASGGPRKREAG